MELDKVHRVNMNRLYEKAYNLVFHQPVLRFHFIWFVCRVWPSTHTFTQISGLSTGQGDLQLSGRSGVTFSRTSQCLSLNYRSNSTVPTKRLVRSDPYLFIMDFVYLSPFLPSCLPYILPLNLSLGEGWFISLLLPFTLFPQHLDRAEHLHHIDLHLPALPCLPEPCVPQH